MIVLRNSGNGIVKTHSGHGVSGGAEGLPVEEVSPTADALTDEKAQAHQVQQSGQRALFDFAENDDANRRTQNGAVDGKTALPDIQHGNGVIPVHGPGEDAVVGPGAENGKGRDPKHPVQQAVLGKACLPAAAAGVQHCQNQTAGNHETVEVDIQRPDGKAPGGIHGDSQGGEGNGGIMTGIHRSASIF